MNKLSIIIPCYFNEQNVVPTFTELVENESNFPADLIFEYIFIDDGSKDGTLRELLNIQKQYPEKVLVIKLSGNFGSYNAILAGLSHATGDCNVVISADLQDPVDMMPKMYDYWKKGIKLVIANRTDNKDPFITRTFSSLFNFLIRKLAISNMPKGGFDYVLFDAQLRNHVVAMDEKNSNSLYLLVWLKYDYVCLPYERQKRRQGKSRWTLAKKVKLFVDSFVAFSFIPIRIITFVGFVLGLASISYSLYILYNKVIGNIEVEGWSTMMIVFLIISSFQMISLGVLGEYLWRSLDASRKRPNFVIENIYKL